MTDAIPSISWLQRRSHMAAESPDLEELVHVEQTFYDAGYTDGFAHGRIHGLIDGRALGRLKGFEIWEEIGFYQGLARTWEGILGLQHDDPSRRALHHIHHLLDLIRQFPTVNSSATPPCSSSGDDIDMVKLQRRIRSRYKALCASLDVRPILRASNADTNKDAREGPQNGAKCDVWALESDPQRSNVQGLSF